MGQVRFKSLSPSISIIKINRKIISELAFMFQNKIISYRLPATVCFPDYSWYFLMDQELNFCHSSKLVH